MDEASVTPITLTAPDMPGDAQEAHFQAALAAAQAEVKDIPDTVGLKIQEAANNEAAKAEAKAQVEDAKAAPAKDGEPEKVEPVREDDAKEAPGTLGKLRRLYNEGKLNEAWKLAFGVDPEKVEPTTKQWKAAKAYYKEADEAITQVRAQAE